MAWLAVWAFTRTSLSCAPSPSRTRGHFSAQGKAPRRFCARRARSDEASLFHKLRDRPHISQGAVSDIPMVLGRELGDSLRSRLGRHIGPAGVERLGVN